MNYITIILLVIALVELSCITKNQQTLAKQLDQLLNRK